MCVCVFGHKRDAVSTGSKHQCRMPATQLPDQQGVLSDISGAGLASSTGPWPLLHGLRVRVCVRTTSSLHPRTTSNARANVIDKVCVYGVQVGRGAGEVENEDVTLAIASRTRHSFVPRPPQETLQQLADQVRGCCVAWFAHWAVRTGTQQPPNGVSPASCDVRVCVSR